jgi:hypothetical protein
MNSDCLPSIEYKKAILLALCQSPALTSSQITNRLVKQGLPKPHDLKEILDEMIEVEVINSFTDSKTRKTTYCLCRYDADLMSYLEGLKWRMAQAKRGGK